MNIEEIINDIIKVEGGYVNDPSDLGGETCWGITKKVAIASGYTGEMKKLTKKKAYDIYYKNYVVEPNFHLVSNIDMSIAGEVVDTGVNMGQAVAGKFLQQALNALNDGGLRYKDVVVDGKVGPATVEALAAYLKGRGEPGRVVLLKALNCLQGARYIQLAEMRQQNERFVYGWISNRVSI
jgi:lysozyme family protein